MSDKIRVVHLMTSFGGGISSFILNKAESLVNQNIIFDVITFGEYSYRFGKAIQDTGGTIYQIADPNKNGLKQFLKEFDAVIKEKPSDTIIHSHFGMNLIVPIYFLTKFRGIERLIIHAHTSAPNKYNDFKRKLNNFFAHEKLSASYLSSVNVFGKENVKNENIVHIPNSIDPSEFLKDIDPTTERINIFGAENINKKIIGHIGRFDPIKNHVFMIELIEKLSQKDDNFLWVFIGEGETRLEVEELVKQKNLTKYVKFLGRRNDLSVVYKTLDLVVLPSFYEGLPTVAIETQAAGIPLALSSTITKECDLGLGLLKFLDIHEEREWLKTIADIDFPTVSKEKRLQKLEEKKFTNETSANIYLDFLKQKIQSYNI